MTTALRLEMGSLVLDLDDTETNGIVIAAIDIPGPTVRAVTNDTQGQDGADDQTQNFSAGSVTLTGTLVPNAAGDSRTKAKDLLAPFLAPNARPTLVWQPDSDVGERRLDMRVTPWSNAIDHPVNASALTLAWVTPNPIAYDSTVNEIDVPITTGSSGGLKFPVTFPVKFVSMPPSSLATAVDTNGTYVSWPILNIYGPCSDPALYWLDPVTSEQLGIQVVFTGLAVASGHFLQIDTRQKTVLLDGMSGASRYSFVDFVNTIWGPLQPGDNLLQFNPASASVPSTVEVLWQDNFLP